MIIAIFLLCFHGVDRDNFTCYSLYVPNFFVSPQYINIYINVRILFLQQLFSKYKLYPEC